MFFSIFWIVFQRLLDDVLQFWDDFWTTCNCFFNNFWMIFKWFSIIFSDFIYFWVIVDRGSRSLKNVFEDCLMIFWVIFYWFFSVYWFLSCFMICMIFCVIFHYFLCDILWFLGDLSCFLNDFSWFFEWRFMIFEWFWTRGNGNGNASPPQRY